MGNCPLPKTLLQPGDFFHSQPYGLRLKEMGISHGLKSVHRTLFTRLRRGGPFDSRTGNHAKIPVRTHRDFFHGDPYGNRTHVTAVKGRCLNRLTNGPGSGNLIRTDDIPGMNRLLYQLSYAAMWSKDFGTAEISFIIVSEQAVIVKTFFVFLMEFLAILPPR